MTPDRPIARRALQPAKRPDSSDPAASMALILDAMRNPLDPSYAEAAKRPGADPRGATHSALLFVTTLILGLLLAVSALALRPSANEAEKRHQQLVDQVHAAQQRNDSIEADVSRTRGEVNALSDAALARTSQHSIKTQLADALRTSGGSTVTGPGVSLTLDEPSPSPGQADSDPRTGGQGTSVTSTDIQQLVNALYRAGASDVAINEQRLNSMSAIRFAGSAILVNYRPLARPYRIVALGPQGLDRAFSDGFGGQYLAAMKRSGLKAQQTSGSVTLPPAPGLTMSSAKVQP